mmetsp:Transcript_31103/g.35715  ORF Transcript_31103/g.35715 Transcript_31103/m.35715 type:complete len:228 (-) Transcript_31103:41-724(-)
MKLLITKKLFVQIVVVFAVLFLHTETTTNAFSFPTIDGLRSRAKADLIDQITSGASNEQILNSVGTVERYSIFNTSKNGGATLQNPLLSGNWLMVWTTSDSIAGKSRPKLFRTETPPEQYLDIENGRAVNSEYLWGIRNSVEAVITPETKNKVQVQFQKFSIGPISYTPGGVDISKFKGELSVTYLDSEMRISRGDKGNAFVLLKESTQQRNEANRIWKEWRKSNGW